MDVTGANLGGTYCASCGKRIYTRVDPEKRLNVSGCGCGEHATPIDAPPWQPQPMSITQNICPSCASLRAENQSLIEGRHPCPTCDCPMYHRAKTGWYCPECELQAVRAEVERLNNLEAAREGRRPSLRYTGHHRAILYTDTVQGEQTCVDNLWAISTEQLNALNAVVEAARKIPNRWSPELEAAIAALSPKEGG